LRACIGDGRAHLARVIAAMPDVNSRRAQPAGTHAHERCVWCALYSPGWAAWVHTCFTTQTGKRILTLACTLSISMCIAHMRASGCTPTGDACAPPATHARTASQRRPSGSGAGRSPYHS